MADESGNSPAPNVPDSSGSWIRGMVIFVVVIGVLGGLAYGAREYIGSLQTKNTSSLMTHKVAPGELLVTVTEDGNMESASNVEIKCQVAGGSSILWIVPDGTFVKKGDKLVELDASSLEEQINTQKIAFEKARAAMIEAEKDFEVAKISVEEYLQGIFKKELQDADAAITIAMENLRTAQNAKAHSERMFRKGYVSSLEVESQQFGVQRADLELNAAKTARDVLVRFTKRKTLEDLESKRDTAKTKAESQRSSFELEEARLKRLQDQKKNCLIVAPQDGMVVYANERGRFGQSGTTVEEGASVRERQTILRLPDLGQMQVKVKVHETKVENLRRGMRARIEIQDRELQGEVTAIANQPEQTSWWSASVKEYATTVKIDGEPESLKPGMTAEVEILIAHLKDILSIPVAAVVTQRGKHLCWVQNPTGYQKRNLLLGLSNDQFVEVKDGLKAGDEVILNPRAVIAEASEGNDDEAEEIDVSKKFGQSSAKKKSPGASASGSGRPGSGSGRPGGGSGRPGGGTAQAGGRPGAGGAAGGGGGQGRGGGRSRSGRSFDLMAYDKDKDGKVSKEEAPERMRAFFDRMDPNKDGFIDKKEIEAMKKRYSGRGGGGGGRGGRPGGGAGGGRPGGGQ